jgi:DNA-directed RNA polymerase specialized sigma24 family protein
MTTPGPQEAFATTRWTVVLNAASEPSPQALAALGAVCQSCWYPLYAYVRRQGFDAHTAQDLTQEFFAKLIEKNYLASADRHRGRFRWFLITAFKCFLANEFDRAYAKKRGGGEKPLSFDQLTVEERYANEPVATMNADLLYDRRWALDLLARARSQLRQEYEAGGKSQRYELLSSFLPGEQPSGTQAELGEQLGLSENAVKQEVHRMKKRMAELIRSEVEQTVSNPNDVDDELRHLIDITCRQ